MRDLLAHQVPAFEWARQRERIALFMEMRLGKTIVAIRWAKELGAKRVLVVGPLSTLGGWQNELDAEGIAEKKICILRGTRNQKWKKATGSRDGWYLINYEGLRVAPELFTIGWDAVILDESTKIRNPTARITKQLTRKLDHVRLRAILTGLPAPEGVMDYYSQMQFLNGTFLGFKEFWPFRERLFLQVGYDWSPKKGIADRIRAEIREHAYILKRKDVNIGSTIVSEVRRVEMTPEQKRLYKELMKKFRVEINGVEYTTKYAIVKQAWAQRIAGGFAPPNPDGTPGVMLSDRKIKEIFYLMETELKDEPLIIWFKFNQELMAMAAALKKAKIDYHTITGATPGPDREKKRRRFQNGKVDIILVQGKVGQMGMDLSRADTEIYYSNWWDYEIRAQSRDRVIHPTKTRPCLAIDLVCQDTVDEDAVAVLNDKAIDAKLFLAKLNERLMAHFKGEARG